MIDRTRETIPDSNEVIVMDYESRLSVPIVPSTKIKLYTKSGLQLASEYKRIVIGKRGPYVEIEFEHINSDILTESDEKHYYYIELRSCSPDNVKVYLQLHGVDYADYVPKMCYVSPFDLCDSSGNALIDSLKNFQKEEKNK